MCLCFSFWNKYLILSWFCHSGLISSFWTELLTSGWRPILLFWIHLVIQGCLRHSMTLTFPADCLILGGFCHSVLNLSFCTKFFIWVEFVIPGWIYQSGLICYSGLVILGYGCHSVLASSFDNFDILGWISHSGTILSFWAEFIILSQNFSSGLNLSFRAEFVNRGWFVILG